MENKLIIVKMPMWRRVIYVGTTALLWGFLIYICQDVPKALLALVVDAEIVIERGWDIQPLRDTAQLIIRFGAITLSLILLFSLWSLLNHLRFGRLKRRTRPEDVTLIELASSFGTTSEKIVGLRAEKIVTVSINESGTISQAT